MLQRNFYLPKLFVLLYRHKKELQTFSPCFQEQTSEISKDAWVMKSTGIFRGTIKGWSKLSFLTVSSVSPFLPLSISLVSSLCVCENVVNDDTEAVASRSHHRWQIWKKEEEQEGRNRLQTAWAILTKSNPCLSEQMGKVTNCDNVVMSHPVNFTLLYLTSHSHVS